LGLPEGNVPPVTLTASAPVFPPVGPLATVGVLGQSGLPPCAPAG
jgi:hypothetical protein